MRMAKIFTNFALSIPHLLLYITEVSQVNKYQLACL